RLVGSKLDSRSNLFKFVEYPKGTARYYFYDPSKQKVFISRNIVLLEKGFSADTRCNLVQLKETSQTTPARTEEYFEPIVPTDGAPILVGRPGNREHLIEKWLEAIKYEMDSIGSNKVLTLVHPPKGVKPIGCKWVYKYKLGADGKVTIFKAGLVEKDTLKDLD
ncbi:UNVERIFIED_CONTAM: hypothetical protein Sindi_1832800, partial [Sesamum indicum]